MRLIIFILMAVCILVVCPPAAVWAQTCKEGDRRVCGSDIGICESGRATCKEGNWTGCEGSKGPEPKEICYNNLDDDCNGETDENCFPWVSLILVGTGMLFIGIGLSYMQHGKGERMLRERVGKD
jgi:hypothetical protein